MRCTFLPMVHGFRAVYGHVLFWTISPDRRHSTLLLHLMRSRRNDTYLQAASGNTVRDWRRQYAGPDTPSLYEEATVSIDASRFPSFPSVQDVMALSANDPLATILHYNACIKVSLPLLVGLRCCLHCPSCSKEQPFDYGYASRPSGQRTQYGACGQMPCQNKFGRNARIFGGTHALADGLCAVTEHQGNDMPHAHVFLSLARRPCS